MLEQLIEHYGAAMLWASAIAVLGYGFGHAIALILGGIEHDEVALPGAVVLAGFLPWAGHPLLSRWRQKKGG